MPERATTFEISNWGKETTPGQAPSTGKRLGSISVRPAYEITTTPYSVIGAKFPFSVALGRESASATLEGWADYEGIVHPLSSVLLTTTPAQQGTTSAYKWTFNPAQSSADTPTTYTIQCGSSAGAQQFSYGLVSELSLEYTTEQVRLTGRMIGRAIQDGATLWSSPTVISPVPVQPKQVAVYFGDSSPTTKIERAFSATWTIRNRWAPVWVLDSSVSGWVTYVEQIPESELTILVEALPSWSDALHTALQNATAKWFKIDAVGGVIAAPYNYTLTITSKMMVTSVREFTDHEGVIAVEWTLRSVYDTTSSTAVKVEVINTQTAL